MPDLDSTIDVHCLDDFLPTMPTIRGREALLQRLYRRLTTPRGRFFPWPDFGFDVRAALLSKMSPSRIATEVQAECLKDEQVFQVEAVVNMTGNAATLQVSVMDDDGPFQFTMTIDEARVQLNDLLESA